MAKRLTATELKALQKKRRSATNQASQSVESISTSYSISDTPKSNDSLNISSSGLNNANSISLHVSDIDLSLNSISRLGASSDSLGELNIKSSGSFGNLKLSSESIQQSVSEAQVSLSRNGSDITLGRSSQSQAQANGSSTKIFSESISSESQPEFNAKLFFKTANVKKEEPVRARSLFDMKTPEIPTEVDSPKERPSKRRRIDENTYEETKIEIKTEIKEENGGFKMEIDQPEENPEKDLGSSFVCDWSIKTRIKLSSYQTFDWCGMISNQLESIAATMFAKGIPDTSSIDIPRANLSSPIPATTHIDFDKSLYYFAYPGGPIPEYLQEMYYSAIQHEEAERDDLLKAAYEDWHDKKTEWAESFKSLFFLLKSKHCQYFYCIFDTFCVLFLTPGLAGYTRLTAIINKSTKRFRRLLEQSDVPFTMPLLKEEDKPKIKSADQEAIKELKEIENLAPKQIKLLDDLPSAIDNEAPSLLLFQGREGVHSLFDFLLNWTAASSAAPEKTTDATIRQKFQIPTLYAPSTFLHAALKKVVVKTSQFKQMSDKTGDLEELSSLEFEGPLLPSSVISLFDIFKQTHSEFKATMEVEPQTVNFNHNFASNAVPPAASPTSSPRVSGLISFVPSTMNEQRYVGPEIRKLYYSDSTFKVRQ